MINNSLREKLQVVLWSLLIHLLSLSSIATHSETVLAQNAPDFSSSSNELVESFILKKVQLLNSTVLTPSEVEQVTKPYISQSVTFFDLVKIQSALTNLYIQKGYVNSIVVLPAEQYINDGVVTFEAREGSVKLEITGYQSLNPQYIRSRLARFLDTPMELRKIEQGLTLLRQDPLFTNLEANLTEIPSSPNSPNNLPPESLLTIKVVEAPKWSLGAEINNDENFTVGDTGVRFFLENQSLLGQGDNFRFEYKITEGLDRLLTAYTLPVNGKNGRIDLAYQQTDAEIVHGLFEVLDIKSEAFTASVGFTQPVIFTPSETFELGIRIDRRENQSYVLNDELFSNVKLTAFRLNQTYIKRSADSLFLGLSQFTFGDSNLEIDPFFFSWQGQVQFLKKIDDNKQFYTRVALQLSPSTLPPSEECTIGGRNGNIFIFGNIVRGYTTNGRTGDSCFAFNGELRFTLIEKESLSLQLFPFVDLGTVTNTRDSSLNPQTLVSTGLGLRLNMGNSLNLQVNYAIPLVNTQNIPGDSLQKQAGSFSLQGQFRF
ncbi:ShlB/FhaC/HecB family hemolysin secretion/activation protein [Gloeothece verrucosa]|uniref:Polypeptide-transport-associated domain protein ShlB-type n=1 Tax=Gloeothece verrucosa (strain PCC 7822) TaxID=497965 RepID=E0UM73_GLOV7|nr:ShlB/FhaC/HecB family hemolysin secretion/activation protein [Gloeothece verrucosa]ADN18053.1 Polypeptide-transport-associated domain protein ShlB-type [Gloeothece verrucosa PCC 7822]